MNGSERDFRPITRPLARRLNFAVWLNAATAPCAWIVGLFATALVCAKLLNPALAQYCVWIFAALPFALAGAALWCKKRGKFFSPAELVETADHLYREDGSVTSAWERPKLAPEGDFAQTVRAALAGRMPRIKALYYARRLAPSACYAALALMLPARPAAAAAPRMDAQASLTEPLIEKIEAMQEFLPEEQSQELREEVEAIAQNPQGISREQWEAIEEVGKRIEESQARTAQDAAKAQSMLEQAAAMLGETKQSASGEKQDPKLQELLKELDKLGKTPNLAMSDALRKQMSDLISECKGATPGECKGLCEKLGKLAGKFGQGAGSQGMNPGPGGSGPKPGRGGISRGRADAALTLGEEQTLDGAKFDEKKLDLKFFRPEDMANLGVTPIEPKPDPGRFSPGAIKAVAGAEASPVSRTRISPGQREVIQKYFSQTEK